MRRTLCALVTCLLVAPSCATVLAQTSKLRVGFCARTLSSATAPFAVATKMGWYKQDGVEVELVALAGSGDCVKTTATKEIPFSLPSVEPLAAARPQGVKAKIFYTAYQGNIYGIAVPADSPIHKITDLKGKTVGVISMGSGGVPAAKALIATAGMNPDKDVNIVVAGEGAQTAAMLRSKQVDALSQFDTQYAMVENAGVKLRLLDTKEIDRYPSNGFLALEETLNTRRKDAIGLARGYAKGTIFTINNPEAAVRILYEVFPELKPTGKDEATAIRDDTKVLQARITNWKLEKAGVKRWGENSEANYAAYAEFLLKWGVIKDKVEAKDLITNELIDEINKFDAGKIVAEAKAYKPGK
ncbi:MAG TPA: ABC transporter substrate-binding protein [Candidatus Binatia bacterium]|jgi:NitT/TauT family transport system substrate-binding protein|nr:ABC transporter substrate-binding protein [Candidatus Binatia bacterium]